MRERLFWGIGGWALVTLACGAAMGFSLAPRSIPLAAALTVGGCICCLRPTQHFGNLTGLAQTLEALLLLSITSVLGAVGSYIAMLAGAPMADGLLYQADLLLGFDWQSARILIERYPTLLAVMEKAYGACSAMPFVVIGILCWQGSTGATYRFLSAYALALLATILVFACVPARAAFAYLPSPRIHVPPNAADYNATIAKLMDGSLRELDLGALSGIITFPSFHAAMAILFCWGAWPARVLRLPIVAINAAMWLAAVPVGGHYLVDLLGGSVIAIVAIASVQRGAEVSLSRPRPMEKGARQLVAT